MKKQEETIHKYSFGYSILRVFVMFGCRFFYRKIQVSGKENIPYESCFIITPNHQNALMDAMAILFSISRKRIVFLARADIFKSKVQNKILTFLKMLPVYRMRDGTQELSKNEEIFDRAVHIVTSKIPLSLMPEGTHGDKRRLRNFVKGAFRIAFRAQQEAGPLNDVLILPVGIDYEHYQKFNQDLLIVIGKPVNIREYLSEYTDNQAKGLNLLRDKISGAIKDLMIHISNDEFYDMYQNMRHIWNSRMKQLSGIRGKNLYDAFRADKLMIRILDHAWETEPETLRALAEKTSKYMTNLELLKMRNWVIARKGLSGSETALMIARIIITSPLALYGFVNNILSYYIPIKLTKKIKDPQFVSSFKFVLSLISFKVFYIIQTLAVGIFSGSLIIAIVYLLSLPVTGYYSLYWSFWVKKTRSGMRFKKLNSEKDKVVLETMKLYQQIMQAMEKICFKYLHEIPLKEKNRYD